jgi:hypothetical protein
MKTVNLIGDCHSTRVWQWWDPETCPVDFKVWGKAGLKAWSFYPEKMEQENEQSSGIETVSQYVEQPQGEFWTKPFGEFKNSDLVMIWVGYVDIRQWMPKYEILEHNSKDVIRKFLDRVREYYKESTIQLIEPLPQFTEMHLKYEDISPSYTYEERQSINKLFVDTLNEYAVEYNMPTPITQQEIKDAIGFQEFTLECVHSVAPHPQDSLKPELWGKIYNLFIEKANDMLKEKIK